MSEDTTTEVESPVAVAKYTDADLQRAVQTRLAKESKKYETQLSELQGKAAKADELEARLAQLEEERELVGKTATEKEAAKYQREVDKLRRDAEEKSKGIAERDATLTRLQQEMRAERATRAMTDALSALKAIRPDKAAKAAMLEITTEHTDTGINASYGDVDAGTVAEAMAAWLKDNDHFLPAPQGGAGTKSGSGGARSSEKLHELSDEELLRLGKR